MVLKITNLHILRYLPTYWLYLLECYTIDNQQCTHTASVSRHPFRPPQRRAAPALFYRQEVTPSVVPIAVRMVTNVWMTSFQIDFLSMFLFFN